MPERTQIQFTSRGTVALPAENDLLRRWIPLVTADHGRLLGPVTYVFCSDEEILAVNRQYLGHDYYTDIITFDDTHGRRIQGDIFISLDTVRSNAQQLGQPFERELRRVIIHGILHLCGINDKGPGERAIMERHEDEALRRLDQLIQQQGNEV